jgi:GT2 family glycosyltransferase
MPSESEGRGPESGAVSVIMACYTEERWHLLLRTIESVRAQTLKPDAFFVVVDYNEELFNRLTAAVTTDVTVLRNKQSRGAGGARNTGALDCKSEYVAFIDDDAKAAPDWLEQLVAAVQLPRLVGAGGAILPDWGTKEPWWFPMEFGWALGLRVLPADDRSVAGVRNVWSANMIVLRRSFADAGGFRSDFGKVGGASEPEDTELCLRLSRATGEGWALTPLAIVAHHVPAERANVRYFLHRCWMEGKGKAAMRSHMTDSDASLSDEKRYLSRTLPRALAAYGRRGLAGDLPSLVRAVLVIAGATVTCAGFVFASGPQTAHALRRRD